MNEVMIAVKYDNDRPLVSGRELHEALGIKTQYSKWFDRMCEYGFAENTDYILVSQKCLTNNPRNPYTEVTDHQMTIDMAKELCMIQRSEIGKKCREYFLEIEHRWNSPETTMARALQFSNQQLEQSKTYTVNDENGNSLAKPHTCWTSKGRLFIYELLKEHGKGGVLWIM